MKLSKLSAGETAVITVVGGEGELRRHFLDMGVIPGAAITFVKLAPMGDPMEFMIHGYELTLRVADAEKIEVEKSDKVQAEPKFSGDFTTFKEAEHPGYGEDGKYHEKKTEDPLPKGTILTFALAGNQNCGKTTLFNALTGSNQHVGNFPGVTVDRKSGPIKGRPDTLVTDLPGIYSLSPYTGEEIVSRNFILDEKPKGIINIVDASNIERNLFLTLQLLELGLPTVIALNMMDEVRGNGGTININAMEKFLGVPVIPISAAKNEGVDEVIEHAVHVAKYRECASKTDFCENSGKGAAVHRCIHGIMELISDHAEAAGIPIRFAATKLIEGDNLVMDALKLTSNEKDAIEKIIKQMEEERGLDRAAAIADMRFNFIEKLCALTVVKPKESKEHKRSRKIDAVLTGKYTAIPFFVLIMATVFFLTFTVIGGTLQKLLEKGIDLLSGAITKGLASAGASDFLISFISDGIIAGVGSVLSFLPVILTLFFFLSMLEDSGYLARVAFFMDKLLRKIGLSGRSIVPMLIGFGCSVPAVMSTRTLPSERDRKMTVMLTPFMSCSAKVPVYVFFTAFFPAGVRWLVMIGLYFTGIFVGIIVALIAKKTAFKGEAVPFVMELPNYRFPGFKNVMKLLWEKAKDFIQRAFTIIFIASVIVWFLQSFDFKLILVSDPSESMMAKISGVVGVIFRPLGFGDWRIVTSLFTGVIAKESVVSTLQVVGAESVLSAMPVSSVLALLVFCLLYTPCVAALAAIKGELGGKKAAFIAVFQCVIAWAFAGLVALIGLIFGF